MSKHDAFSPPPSSSDDSEIKSTVGDGLDDLIDAGTSVIENVASQVQEYTQGVASSEPAAVASAQSSQSACKSQGGQWLTPGSPLYQGDGTPYCAFFPPEMVQGMARCDKVGGVYDAAFNRCVSKAAANQPYTQQDLDCSKQGKVFNYVVQSCVTFEESQLIEQNNADLICGKDSVLTTSPEGFKACMCKPGYDWKDSGATTDCVKKATGGGTPVKQTVKTGKTTPPVTPSAPTPERYKKSETNWALYGGIAAAVALVGGAYWYSKNKKKSGGQLEGYELRHQVFASPATSDPPKSTVGLLSLLVMPALAAYGYYQKEECEAAGGVYDVFGGGSNCTVCPAGYQPVDGVCQSTDPATTGVGAAQSKIDEGTGVVTPPASKPVQKGGTGGGTATATDRNLTEQPPAQQAKPTNWALYGGIAAVAVVGGMYWYSKKK